MTHLYRLFTFGLLTLIVIGFSLPINRVLAQSGSVKPTELVQITGILEKSANITYINLAEPAQNTRFNPDKLKMTDVRYEVLPLTAATANSLKRLKSGDFIRALAELRGNAMLIAQIDFVGLTDLLGSWANDKMILRIKSYSHMKINERTANPHERLLYDYHYAVSPSEGDEWNLFLTAGGQVNLARVDLQDKKLTFMILDNESGEIKKTLLFDRIR